MAKFSPLYNVTIDDAKADVRAEFSVADKHDLGGPPGAFQQVSFHLEMVSPSPAEDVSRLIARAERACHAAQTFKVPVPTRLETTLNGTPLPLDEK